MVEGVVGVVGAGGVGSGRGGGWGWVRGWYWVGERGICMCGAWYRKFTLHFNIDEL